EQRDQLVTVAHARGVRPEALVAGELGAPKHVAETCEEAVVRSGDGDPAVGRAKGLVRGDARMRVAEAAGLLAGDERVLRDVDKSRKRRVEQRDLDPLAPSRRLAAAERGDDRDGGMEAGHDVDERNARL